MKLLATEAPVKKEEKVISPLPSMPSVREEKKIWLTKRRK